ncbi:MAG: IS1380 family transposase [Proteobacteria bacterium]|nr:IS1380 family transposase [Pseudomonadota bacterium]MBU1714018.1 IS1380 family transposase [Pseudomonadota bacterium]
MPQGLLPFKYEAEKKQSGLTALGGLPVYLDLANVAGLQRLTEKHLAARKASQGWRDSQMITALTLLNLTGGDCVDDLEILESDEGFCQVMRRAENHGLPRQERRKLEKRWRKKSTRTLPSASSVFRYLDLFHDPEQEKLRVTGKAFIPATNKHLAGFTKVNQGLVEFLQANKSCATATLDMDATLVETHKSAALYGYKGFCCYQPFNTWWAEQEVILHTEFRDGNVPAGFEQLRVFKEALNCLPQGVEKVRLRSDTAGYQHDLLRYCEMEKNERFNRIEFAIGCSVTKEFKKAVAEVSEEDWHPVYIIRDDKRVPSGTEWAEICFVPNAIGHSKNAPVYRYLAKRSVLNRQQTLPGVEQENDDLPFPTMDLREIRYKVFGIVTNMDWNGERLIHWHHERCGKSEEAHAIMKDDLAGGKLPSGKFGANAAWWWIMILALNLNNIMKSLALNAQWQPKRLKAIRFKLINLPGRVVEHARTLWVRLSGSHPNFDQQQPGSYSLE